MHVLEKLKYQDQTPEAFVPNGDRYLVEVLDVDDNLRVGAHVLVVPPASEIERGWRACRIVSAGNGHRLEADVSVPMFFEPGDVVLAERLTGRELKLQGRTYLIINQVDILGSLPDA